MTWVQADNEEYPTSPLPNLFSLTTSMYFPLILTAFGVTGDGELYLQPMHLPSRANFECKEHVRKNLAEHEAFMEKYERNRDDKKKYYER